MRKTYLSIIIAVVVFIVAVLCCRSFWSADKHPVDTQPSDIVASDLDNIDSDNSLNKGLQTYENGLAEFTYDSNKIVFMEMPSDDEDGYPMTSFLMLNNEDVLPRLDVIPMKLTEPFTESVSVEEWQQLVKSLILAYYNTSEQEQVNINFSDGVVKVNEGEAKMYVYVSTKLDASATPDLNGVIRLTANNKAAVVTLALAHRGESIPSELEDVYMSINIQ